MTRGGKREGAGRKSRKLNTTKISAYVQDREFLNELSKQLDIPVVELLHQIIIHEEFKNLYEKLKSSQEIKDWYKSQD